MKKKLIGSLLVIIVVLGLLLGLNQPLRTAVYRSVFRHSSYIISDKDTVYSFGYAGVQKFLLNQDGKTTLLKENDSFCHNCIVGYLMGRSGCIVNNYLYVAARSYLGGRYKSKEKNYKKGCLYILDKSSLEILKEIETDYSMIEVKCLDTCMVVSGLQGFNIYNVKDVLNPQLTYQFRTEKAWEFQGCEIFVHDGRRYVAFARWADGLSIYDITDINNVKLFRNIRIEGTKLNGVALPKGLQQFRVVLDYPYLYSTIGPTKRLIGTSSDIRGIMAYDFSNLDSIHCICITIPKKYWYTKVNGDPQPTHIAIYGNHIYTNFSEKGIVSFVKNRNNNEIKFEKIINASDGRQILPIHINKDGILLMGDYRSEDIISYNLKK